MCTGVFLITFFIQDFSKGKEQTVVLWITLLGQKRRQQKLLYLGSFDLIKLSCILEKAWPNHHLYIKTVPYKSTCIYKINFKSTLFLNFLLSGTGCLNCLATLTACKELHASCQIMNCARQLGN